MKIQLLMLEIQDIFISLHFLMFSSILLDIFQVGIPKYMKLILAMMAPKFFHVGIILLIFITQATDTFLKNFQLRVLKKEGALLVILKIEQLFHINMISK